MTQNSLTLTRQIERPSREAMLQRTPSVHQFWNNNTSLFEDAWKEWERSEELSGLTLDETLYARDRKAHLIRPDETICSCLAAYYFA